MAATSTAASCLQLHCCGQVANALNRCRVIGNASCYGCGGVKNMTALERWFASMFITMTACAPSPEIAEVDEDLLGGGGWDYNNNRFNPALERISVGPMPPYGDAGANTLDRYSYKVFQLRPQDGVQCLSRDPEITGVRVVGSTNVAGAAYGPRVMVDRNSGSRALAIGEETVVAASLRTLAMDASEAVPVELHITYVEDFVRPGGWIRWPQYAVTMYDSECEPHYLAVSILGPAFDLRATANDATSVTTVPGVVVPYSGFYDATDPSLIAKAAINLDGALSFSGENTASAQSCATGTPVPANLPTFIGALVTGAAVVTYHPNDVEHRPIVVFRTKKGQAFKAHASVMVGGQAQPMCLRNDMQPAGTSGIVRNSKVAWPTDAINSIDVVHASGLALVAGELAASRFTWILSGTSTRRTQAFLGSSTNPLRYMLSAQADAAAAAVSVKTQEGRLETWSSIDPLVADRVTLVMSAETLPDEQVFAGVEYATDYRMLHVTYGDGTCSIGEVDSGSPDCSFHPPPQQPYTYQPDAGTGYDAPYEAGTPDAGNTADAGGYEGSPADAGGYEGSPADAGGYEGSPADAGGYEGSPPDAGTTTDAGGYEGSPPDGGMQN
jgi:hypothetical protein